MAEPNLTELAKKVVDRARALAEIQLAAAAEHRVEPVTGFLDVPMVAIGAFNDR